MLYDPKWEVPKVKADPFTLDDFIAWLEKQPGREKYDFMACNGRCLYGQYATSHGVAWREAGTSILDRGPIADFCTFVYDHIAGLEPYTFGAALERAREAMKVSNHQSADS